MSATPQPAKLAYLTSPEPKQFVINVQTEDEAEPKRFAINREQLLNINAQSADMLQKAFR